MEHTAANPKIPPDNAQKFTPSLKHRIPGLDEIRGVAILLVLGCHALHVLWDDSRFDSLAYLGVNIFFVVSGYLICTILLADRGKPNFFRRFYIRRIFRIWPLFLVITGMGLLVWLWQDHPILPALPYYLTFTMNFAWDQGGPAAGESIIESGKLIPFTSPMWSLAIEEQFYLFLPVLVHILSPKRFPVVVMLVCALAIIGAQATLHLTPDADQFFAYPNFKNTALRIHYLGIGVLLAARPAMAYLVIIFWLIAAGSLFDFIGFGEALVALVMVAFIQFTIYRRPLIRSRFLAWAGVLCYGLYLIHWPILRISEKALLSRMPWSTGPFIVFFVFLGASFAAAHYSFKRFEQPMQKHRTKFEIRAIAPAAGN